jgi:peptidyl-prolyl cis-trans isomerase C
LAKIQKIDINSSEFKIKFLNDLVKTQILAQIATDRGLDKSEDVLRALRDTRDTLLAAKIREELKKNITVSYAEIKAFYDKNKQYFKKPQEVKIREIIVDSESSAKDLYVRLLQGESFDALARQYSTAESRSRGGERDWISPTPEELQTNVKFWAAIATVEKGNLSNIFKGDDNKYYIVKVEDIRGGQDISLSEVEKKLEDALRAEKIDVEESKLIDKFKQKARVEKSEDLLK